VSTLEPFCVDAQAGRCKPKIKKNAQHEKKKKQKCEKGEIAKVIKKENTSVSGKTVKFTLSARRNGRMRDVQRGKTYRGAEIKNGDRRSNE